MRSNAVAKVLGQIRGYKPPTITEIKVESLDHLISLAKEEHVDCFITLGESGAFRSSKSIRYYEPQPTERYHKTGKFDVYNDIDDTFQTLWPSQLWTRSNIGPAIDSGTLYVRQIEESR